ncbi:MAG: glucose-1-phosphate adenylyltransferase subunit GlgD [Clostridiales bacterium]|nr:glucose-1-phosphate adenylyltransferase subunit GlgD [Clostridiales bacterium]
MSNMMGIILTGDKKRKLKELSAIRSSSAIPVGGKYRAIDFTLSNMVNSGLTNVGIITQYSFRSLMDHIGSGKEWDLDRKNDGLYIFPPSLREDNSGWYKGSADSIYNNLSFLKRSNEEYVIIAPGNCIYRMSFKDMLQYHIKKSADITIAYREMNDFTEEDLQELGMMSISTDGRVTDLLEKPHHPEGRDGSMGIYILRRELLISLVEECVSHGDYDLVKDVIIKKLPMLKVYAYKFDGYWRNFSTLRMYYRCNKEMLESNVARELFEENGKIYTKVKDEAPAKYNEEAEVTNSIVADGCIIEGTVINSVLFRDVKVGKGALVRDSIVMQGARIGEYSKLEYCILDKDVVISRSKQLIGEYDWPVVVEKRAVV